MYFVLMNIINANYPLRIGTTVFLMIFLIEILQLCNINFVRILS